MRLTVKHSLMLSALSAIVLSSTIAMVYVTEKRHLVAQLEKDQRAALEKLASVCRNSFLEEDDLSLLAYLKSFWSSTEPGLLAYVVVLDDKGGILMHSDFLTGDLRRKNRPAAEPALQAALKAGGILSQEASDGPRRLLVLSAPIEVSDRRQGTVAIAYDKEALDASLRAIQRGTLVRLSHIALAGLPLSLLFAFLLARGLTKPIQDLRAGAERIGRGDLRHRIAASGKDELGDLAREFNVMAGRLAELDELKDSFLAQITHDLRNPLAASMGRLELLLGGYQGTLTQEQTQSLQMALDSSKYLNELINNILDLTKMEAGKMDFQPRSVDLRKAVSGAIEMLRVKAQEYGVSLDGAGVPEGTVVWADEQALTRVLINLVSNALKFTPEKGRVSVSWRKAPSGADRIAVKDTGIGIPEDKLQALFKKFSQIPETQNEVRQTRGTGLGLVICKEIVEAHGGRIGVESRYKQGATFFFELPAKKPAKIV